MSHIRRDLAWIFTLALAVRIGIAVLIRYPGYMDAAYYAAGAVRIAQGGGLTEPFIWNYLDDPQGLPQPGYLYWMPLPSFLAAPMATLFPGSFLALQLPFAIISAFLVPMTYLICWQVTSSRRLAWTSALLMLFSGFFFPYWTLPETFAPFGVVGCLALWITASSLGRSGTAHAGLAGNRRYILKSVLVGVLAGLAHLTRADGVLILFTAALWVVFGTLRRSGAAEPRLYIVAHLGGILGGYLLIMMPWFVRNIGAVGHPLATGGTKTLWLTQYDDLFCYGCDLSPRSYLEWGWGSILRSKLQALGVNLERFIAEDCLVFLLPFVLVGLYHRRRTDTFTPPGVYLVIVFLAHSIAFTFPGPRGGFFHASSAALPFLLAAGADGMDIAVRWAAVRRHWRVRQAQDVFAAAAVAGAVALSGYVTLTKVPEWLTVDAAYSRIGRWLAEQDAGEAVVMSGNPPALWYHTGHTGVVVPNGGVETLLTVADRYGVDYLLLDRNHPAPLEAFYVGMDRNPRLEATDTDTGDTRLYAVTSQ